MPRWICLLSTGVGGTSLQMIADAIGVTKAAVYHQFNTNEEIVVAALPPKPNSRMSKQRSKPQRPSRPVLGRATC
jgi:hypothetical protein